MDKHYLLSPRSKDISIFDVANISDDEAFELFKKIRWSENDGKPICPICGNTEKIGFIQKMTQIKYCTQMSSKPKISIDQQIEQLETKGISFDIYSKDRAKSYLEENNHFFRIKSYAKNYDKSSKGKYINLDFAYLVEFATLDLHFRRLILSWCLDIEHHLKMILMRHFNNNTNEDGYAIVKDFLQQNTKIKNEINGKRRYSSFIQNLLTKCNNNNLALWHLLEVLSFGDFLKLFDFYFSRHSKDKCYKEYHSLAFSVKILRNASAHNNCMLNTLKIPYNKAFKPSQSINTRISKIKDVSKKTRKNLSQSPVLHDFLALLFLLDEICHSKSLKQARIKDLLHFLKRCKKHKDYFKKENFFTSRFHAIQKITIFLIKSSRRQNLKNF